MSLSTLRWVALSFFALSVALLFAVPQTRAATCTFASIGDDDWDTAGNWDCGVIPDDNDDVIIPAATTTVISTGGFRIINTLAVGAGSTLTATGTTPSITFRVNVSTTNEGTITALGGTQLQPQGLTVNSGSIDAGSTFFHSLINSGTVDTGSGILGVSSDLDNTGGTLATTNRISFSGPTSTTITGGFSLVGDIEVQKSSGGTVDLSSNITTSNGDLILASGTLRLNGNQLQVEKDWNNTGGTLDSTATGTVRFGPTTGTISEEPGFFIIFFEVLGATKTLTGDIAVAGQLQLSSGTLEADSFTITIKGTGTGGDRPFLDAGTTFDPGTGTVIFSGEDTTNGTTIDLPDYDFYDLQLLGDGITYNLTADISVTGPNTLTVGAGDTLVVGTDVLTVSGTIVNNGLITVDFGGGGNILHPAESITITDSAGSAVATINGGGDVYVTLQDSDQNLDGTAVETVDVTVTGDAASGSDSETLTLTETGVATGIFRNTTGLRMAHIIGSPTAESGRLEITADGVLTASYTDPEDGTDTASDTAAASTAAATVPAPASSGGGGLGASPGLPPVTTEVQSVTVDGAVIPVHTLVKLVCPAGAGVNHVCTAVYYVSSQGKRHAFPNDKVYFTWYHDFSGVQLISETQMAGIVLGNNVTYKPGVRMVKFTTDPKVYAVEKGGLLRWVTTEAVATALYGSAWNTMIDDINDAFHSNYRFGADIASTADYNAATAEASVTFPSDSLQM